MSHKTENMIDVVNKKCNKECCKTRPCYNFEYENKGLYCVIHKEESMVDVVNKKCIEEGCETKPIYNFQEETIAKYCVSHKTDNMIDVSHKKCKTHLCFTRIQEKYEGYCLYCYINTFPEKPVSRNYKTKEFAVVEFVKNNFPNFDWSSDKIIKDGCSKKRPDLLLELGYQNIIIEIDENQHNNYDSICENKRIMELSQDLGHMPIIFIRFNPDKYYKKDSIITSCWSINKNGICVISESKKTEWITRLNLLQSQIEFWINPINKIDKTIEIINLFYDDK